jgi:regulator of RNase E activity RraA
MKTKGLICIAIVTACSTAASYGLTLPKDQMIALTSQWQGERYPDGRPKVPSAILDRMKDVSLEEAWGVLRGAGYHKQFEGEWKMIHSDEPVVGRALTAQYMPGRPDVEGYIDQVGEEQGRIGGSNSWPIDELKQGDVYVADGYGKINEGTLIGDNLGNAIYANSGNGVVFNASLRDLEGLEEIDGFNAFVRGWHPSAIKDMMLTGINVPIRIGEASIRASAWWPRSSIQRRFQPAEVRGPVSVP